MNERTNEQTSERTHRTLRIARTHASHRTHARTGSPHLRHRRAPSAPGREHRACACRRRFLSMKAFPWWRRRRGRPRRSVRRGSARRPCASWRGRTRRRDRRPRGRPCRPEDARRCACVAAAAEAETRERDERVAQRATRLHLEVGRVDLVEDAAHGLPTDDDAVPLARGRAHLREEVRQKRVAHPPRVVDHGLTQTDDVERGGGRAHVRRGMPG